MAKINKENKIDFFIANCPRSGSTLLAKILDKHPNIIIPDETGFLYKFLGLTKVLKIPRRTYHYRQLYQTNKSHTGDYFYHLNLSDYSKIESYFSSYYKGDQKNILFGEKTPRNWFFINYLQKHFPNRKLLFLVRNPISCVNSYKKYKQPWFPFFRAPDYLHINVFLAAIVWKKAAKKFINKKSKKNIRLIKYENLLKKTKKELNSITDFLGLDFKEEMLEYYKDPKIKEIKGRKVKDLKHRENLSKPVQNTQSPNKDNISARELNLITFFLRNELRYFNYNSNYKNLSTTQRLLYINSLIISYLFYYYSLGRLFILDIGKIFRNKIDKINLQLIKL